MEDRWGQWVQSLFLALDEVRDLLRAILDELEEAKNERHNTW